VQETVYQLFMFYVPFIYLFIYIFVFSAHQCFGCAINNISCRVDETLLADFLPVTVPLVLLSLVFTAPTADVVI